MKITLHQLPTISDKPETHPILPLTVVITDVFLLFALFLGLIPSLAGSYPLEMRTNGLIQLTLLLSWIRFLIVVLAVIVLAGGWRARDLGLRREDLIPGLLGTASIWLVMGIINLVIGLLSPSGLIMHQGWTQGMISWTAGEAVAQFFGNAFVEEVIYRGFMIGAIYHAFPDSRGRKSLPIAIIVSQLLFSLPHLPLYLFSGYSAVSVSLNLGIAFLLGLLFALVYLRTGNLFLTIGIHALVNTPMPLFAIPGWLGKLLPIVLGLVIIAIWPGSRVKNETAAPG